MILRISTVMELEVRVPVLSAHIAVTCPIVSQAPTRRTFMIARGKYGDKIKQAKRPKPKEYSGKAKDK